MKHTKKTLAVFLLALALVLGLVPGIGLMAQAAGDPISYKAASVNDNNKVTFTDAKCDEYTVVDDSTTEMKD